MRVLDSAMRWSRWSEWVTSALSIIALAALGGVLMRVPRSALVLWVVFGVAAAVTISVGPGLIRLRHRLFPGRSMMQAVREAATGLKRLQRGGPFDSYSDVERLARWHLVNHAESLWGAATVLGMLAIQTGDELRGRPGYATVLWGALLFLIAAVFIFMLWKSIYLRRAVVALMET